MLHRNDKLVWTGVNRHNLDTVRNDHLCCGIANEKISLPKRSVCVFNNN